MSRGIIIFGASGSGTTTLGREVARRLYFPHFDLDDYHWCWDAEIPFTVLRSVDEKRDMLMKDISKYPRFVMSGSMESIRKTFDPMFDLAVFVSAPTEIRVERVRAREFAWFGERILLGGDMYKNHQDFLAEVRGYDTGEPPIVCLKRHERWIAELPCPVLRVDGTREVSENAELVAARYRKGDYYNGNH